MTFSSLYVRMSLMSLMSPDLNNSFQHLSTLLPQPCACLTALRARALLPYRFSGVTIIVNMLSDAAHNKRDKRPPVYPEWLAERCVYLWYARQAYLIDLPLVPLCLGAASVSASRACFFAVESSFDSEGWPYSSRDATWVANVRS